MANISAIKLPDGNTYDIKDNSKQDVLVSGTNIKTINNTSLLGSGNLDVSDIYWVEYGVTTYADITTAINAGKEIIAWELNSSGNTIYYTFVANSVSYDKLHFVRLQASSTKPTQDWISVDTTNTWTKETTVLGTFPVDSIYVTSTNSNPSSYLGGTWSLIDKEFTPAWITTGFTFNTTNTQNGSFVVIASGHTLEFRLSWNNKVAASDNTVTIGTFNTTAWTSNCHNIYATGYNDLLNGIGMFEFSLGNDTATLSMYDVTTRATSIPTSTGTDSKFFLNMSVNMHSPSAMVDSKCNKFFWKRTA